MSKCENCGYGPIQETIPTRRRPRTNTKNETPEERKERIRLNGKLYYARNKDKIIAKNMARYEVNRDTIKEYAKNRYHKKKEERLQRELCELQYVQHTSTSGDLTESTEEKEVI